jgi:hypothetical protein
MMAGNDVLIPPESAGAHNYATNELIELAAMFLVRHAGGRIKISDRLFKSVPDGTLAYGFVGKDERYLEFVWARHEATPGIVAAQRAVLAGDDAYEANIRLGFSLLVLEAGGRLRFAPFDPDDMPEGVLTFGSAPDGGYLFDFIHIPNS